MRSTTRLAALLLPVLLLAACATPSPDTPVDVAATPWASDPSGAQDNEVAPGPWEHYKLPGKAATRFDYARKDGRDALSVTAASSASMLRHKVHIAPRDLGNVRFSWQVPRLIEQADMALRDADDSPVRVILAFDGDRRRWSARNSMLSELARTLTGEEMPYATLMYVWCNRRQPGEVIHSPRTDRVRKIVLESGPQRLNRWLDYERDIRADYLRAFGEEPGALVGIAIMTDTDNTRSRTQAWYGPLKLVRAPGGQAR